MTNVFIDVIVVIMYTPKSKLRFLLKTEKNKWFASDAGNKKFNPLGIKFVVDKRRAHDFMDQNNAAYWAAKIFDDCGVHCWIVEEKI